MSRGLRRWVCVSCWLALLPGACDGGDEEQPASDASSPAPARDADAPQDAQPALDADLPADAGAVDSGWVPPFVPPLPDSVCALAVGAQCDGSEDCAQGETCCGRFEPALVAYTSIACRSECSDRNDIELCHAGEPCANGEAVCRTSLIIPHDFIGVCARPESAVAPVTGTAVAGEVTCGATSCAVGSEKCCLRARYDFRTMSIDALEPYCAELDANCSCNHVPAMPDAGPPVPDAGPPIPDAGQPVDEDGGI